ncbi:MAG: prepilin peptidase [Chloroflexi bacterium]|nr:MAG: prepilin peptidase [Chloroflexota bacterium]
MIPIAIVAPFLTAYLTFVGLVLGSFINLVADRLPRGESIVRPRSHCVACDRELNAIDLLPVLGYWLRRGRCATCGCRIGVSAPLVEAVAGALMVAPIISFGLWPGAAAGLCLVAGWGLAVTSLAAHRYAASARARAR